MADFKDRYKVTCYRWGTDRALTLAFCNLLTANLLEIRESTEPGRPRKAYRLRQGVPVQDLSHPIERLVAGELGTFIDFEALLQQCRAGVAQIFPPLGAPERALYAVGRLTELDPITSDPSFLRLWSAALEKNALQADAEPAGC